MFGNQELAEELSNWIQENSEDIDQEGCLLLEKVVKALTDKLYERVYYKTKILEQPKSIQLEPGEEIIIRDHKYILSQFDTDYDKISDTTQIVIKLLNGI